MLKGEPSVLHVGCGGSALPLNMAHCKEVRLDIDPETSPDILADMADLPADIGPFDVVYSCHSLEHLSPHKVAGCLEGFRRVLKIGGVVLIFVPDLEGLSPTDDVLYEVEGGPIRAKDLFYGWGKYLESRPYMAHKTGFIGATLRVALEAAGFEKVSATRLPGYNLLGFGVKGERREAKEKGSFLHSDDNAAVPADH
jgi:SAM-dependent methyltransferase